MTFVEPDQQDEQDYLDEQGEQDTPGDQALQNHPEEQGEKARGPVAKILVAMVRGYQMVVSPWFAPRCRYFPSCSQYAVVAVSRHGVVRGLSMATWRVLRCNPWSLGGVDHVPEHPGSPRTLLDSPPASSTGPHAGACGSDQAGPDQT